MSSSYQRPTPWPLSPSDLEQRAVHDLWERTMQNVIYELQTELKQLRQELKDRDSQLSRRLEESAQLYSSLSSVLERLSSITPPEVARMESAPSGAERVSGLGVAKTATNARPTNGAQNATVVHPGTSLREVERTLFASTLAATGGNRTRAAQMLGVSLRTVRNKIREYGLPPRTFHSAGIR